MAQLVELGHSVGDGSDRDRLYSLPGILLESVGPIRHEVRVPFHDSQVKGRAVLIQTGWDSRYGTDAYWEPGPFLSDDVIFRLNRAGARLVGVDFWATPSAAPARDAETCLIAGGKIALVENLCNLSTLPPWNFRFCVVPLDRTSASRSMVRAFAEIT